MKAYKFYLNILILGTSVIVGGNSFASNGGSSTVGVPGPGGNIHFAGRPAARVYAALDVEEVNPLPPGYAGYSKRVKSLGGIVCSRGIVIVPNAKPSFDCDVATSINAGEIYEGLNVEATQVNPEALGVGIFKKKAGFLTCEKSQVIYPGAEPRYSCIVD